MPKSRMTDEFCAFFFVTTIRESRALRSILSSFSFHFLVLSFQPLPTFRSPTLPVDHFARHNSISDPGDVVADVKNIVP